MTISIRTKEGKIIAKVKGSSAIHIVRELKSNNKVISKVRKTLGVGNIDVLEVKEDLKISIGNGEMIIYLNDGYFISEL